MEPLRDPEGMEPKYLQQLGRLAGMRTIEIGSGDGRLTWRYASLAKSVFGIDPDLGRVRDAFKGRPRELSRKVDFAQAESEYLPFKSETFDIALFAWSL